MMKLKTNENLLVRRIRKGDKDAFGEIYDTYVKKVYKFIFFKVPTHELAEDISHEVFISLLKFLQAKDREMISLQALIYRIARNRIADYYKLQSHKNKDLELIEEISPDVEVAGQQLSEIENFLDQKITVEVVFERIKKLKNKDYQEVLVLRFIEDLSFKQIANIMDKNVNNLRTLLSRALKELKKDLLKNLE